MALVPFRSVLEAGASRPGVITYQYDITVIYRAGANKTVRSETHGPGHRRLLTYSKGWSDRNRVCGGTTLISKIDGEIRRHTTLISNFQKLCATKQNFRFAACGGEVHTKTLAPGWYLGKIKLFGFSPS